MPNSGAQREFAAIREAMAVPRGRDSGTDQIRVLQKTAGDNLAPRINHVPVRPKHRLLNAVSASTTVESEGELQFQSHVPSIVPLMSERH